jgi:hypothetical protein
MLAPMMRALAFVVATLVVAAPSIARAGDGDAPAGDAPAPADPKEAKRWMNAGDTLIKAGDKLARKGKAAEAQSQYERALTSYQRAYELTGNPQVFYAIAAAEEKLGRQVDALLHYRRVTLEVAANPQLVELATQRLAALSADVGLFTAIVVPGGADLVLDDKPIGKAPMTEPLVLQPGTYKLSISADGFQPVEQEITIDAGSESQRTFELEPVPVVFEKPKEAPRPVVRKIVPAPSSVPLWIAGTLAIGLTATGTITGVVAFKKHNTFADPETDEVAREDARKSGKRLSLVTDICLGGAIVATAFTAYWYFKVYRPKASAHRRSREKPIQEAKVTVAPWVQPSIGGVTFAVTY